MTAAFLIIAHKNPCQIQRLCTKLVSKSTEVFLHLDGKMKDFEYAWLISTLTETEVHILEKRVRVYWSHVSGVYAMKALIDTVMEFPKKFDYYILLSGQDYPIKSLSSLLDYLENSKNLEFIKAFPFPYNKWGPTGGYNRIKEYWLVRHYFLNGVLRRAHKHHLLPERQFPFDMHPCGGGDWWALSRPCVQYIHSFLRDNPKYLSFFRFSESSSEYALNILVGNSPFRNRITNHHLTCTDWSRGGSHPKILTCEDFERVRESTLFFARKFDTEVDSAILDLIDADISMQRN